MLLSVASETYTLTVLTNLRDRNGFSLAEPRSGDNNAFNFLEDVLNYLNRRCLLRGDILVRVNANHPSLPASVTGHG